MGEALAPIAYRPSEAADVTGLSRSVIYELLHQGKLSAKKCGKATLIPRESLEVFIASLPDWEPSE